MQAEVSASNTNVTGSALQGNTWRLTNNDTEGSQETLLESHSPLVLGIVNYMIRRLPPWIDHESLAQSGVVRLLDAARRYDSCRDVQ